MGINDIIVYIVIGFFCLGAIDKCLGNKWVPVLQKVL